MDTQSIPEETANRYLVVSLLPPNLSPHHRKQNPGVEKQELVGNRKPQKLVPDSGKDGLSPFIVVMPITEKAPKAIKLFVLRPKSDFCTPFTAHQKDSLHFKEFRDGSTSFTARGTNWNRKVGDAVKQLFGSKAAQSEKQRRFKKAHDPGYIGLEPHKVLGAEL